LHTNEGMVYVDLYVVEWHLLDSGLAKYLYTASTHKKIASWSTYQRHPFLLKYGVPSMEITFERSRQTKRLRKHSRYLLRSRKVSRRQGIEGEA
uniref:Uncharacterized protein n=1 Tax=Parascaris univalens TaxID=6257 RepID=A0A915A0E3_PARUN